MRNHSVKDRLHSAAPIILAALTTFWAAYPATAAEAQLKQVSDSLIEISGGSGAQAWKIKYGTRSDYSDWADRPKVQLVAVEGHRAWFRHGRWLRLIDTQKGMVVGRWHFPGEITNLTPRGNQVQVDLETHEGGRRIYASTLLFDPANPRIPFWPTGYLLLFRVPDWEATWPFSPARGFRVTWAALPTERVKQLLPEFEDAVRRDPLSPWFRVSLGRLLQQLGDPRAKPVFREAVQVPTTDFTEMLRISALLDELGEHEAARTAFERGYQDFIVKGNDPRLLGALINRLIHYPAPFQKKDLPDNLRLELAERIYRLSPYTEGADLAWQLLADNFAKKGSATEAAVWRARAEDARKNSTYVGAPSLTIPIDQAMLVLIGSVLAAVLYLVILYFRYLPQRRLDLAARMPRSEKARGLRFFNIEYWNRSERICFVTIALGGWLAVGIGHGLIRGFMRWAGTPLNLGSGSLAGPAAPKFFEQELPPTPDRDLLLAVAYQQSGEKDKAERLYRALPQFAESWNNLGVLLKESGKEAEARQAYEKALELDPKLAEAALNLGQPPQSFWTEVHQRYLPGRPMLAPPLRKQMLPAWMGASPVKLLLGAWAGPFTYVDAETLDNAIGSTNEGSPQKVMLRLTQLMIPLVLVLALVVPFFPNREVTQSPPGKNWLWGLFLPGAAPVWSVLGGIVLQAWCYFLVQAALTWKYLTPHFFTYAAAPNLMRGFGAPGEAMDIVRLINPSSLWLYAAPAILFAVNLVLVLRGRRAGG